MEPIIILREQPSDSRYRSAKLVERTAGMASRLVALLKSQYPKFVKIETAIKELHSTYPKFMRLVQIFDASECIQFNKEEGWILWK